MFNIDQLKAKRETDDKADVAGDSCARGGNEQNSGNTFFKKFRR